MLEVASFSCDLESIYSVRSLRPHQKVSNNLELLRNKQEFLELYL